MGGKSSQSSSQADHSVTINNVDNSLDEGGGSGSGNVVDNLNVVNSTLDSITLTQTDHGAVLGALDVVKATLSSVDANSRVNAQVALDAIDSGNKTSELAIKGQTGAISESLMKYGALSLVAVAVGSVLIKKVA